MSKRAAKASTFSRKLAAFSRGIALLACCLSIVSCTWLWSEIYDETYEIDPSSDTYQALVESCFDDDLACEDLCYEVLLQNKVYSLDDLDEPEILECRIATPAATHVRVRYELL